MDPIGDYPTPPLYARAAHNYLARYLSKSNRTSLAAIYDSHNWWDMAAGSGNLMDPCPIDMQGRLFLSTLLPVDVEAMRQSRRFLSASIFPFDFLNDPEERLPVALRAARIPGSRWVFLVNPPFQSLIPRTGASTDPSNSAIRQEMRDWGYLGFAARNLATQFLFRLLCLSRQYNLDATIAVFSQAAWLVSDGLATFREEWLCDFAFQDGFCCPSWEFTGHTQPWPIVFTIWRRGGKPKPVVVDAMINGKVIGRKALEPAKKPLGKWVPHPSNTQIAPPLTSALAVEREKAPFDKLAEDALGYVVYRGNDIRNSKHTCLLSSTSANGGGWAVTPSNFEKSMVAAGARALITGIWYTDADCFSAPNVRHPVFKQFCLDMIAWFLASNMNHSSSFWVDYKGRLFDIQNHFFWLRPDEVLAISDLPDTLRAQCQAAEPRFVARWLEGKTFSPDAAEVLRLLKELVVVSIPHRDRAEARFQLDRYDAGLYQIRHGLFKANGEYKPSKELEQLLDTFNRCRRRLGVRLKKLVYELGMLPEPMMREKG